MKKPLSKFQMTSIVCCGHSSVSIIFTQAERIDGMTLTSLFIGTALVFIPVIKSLRANK